jgi:hypothetical protein
MSCWNLQLSRQLSVRKITENLEPVTEALGAMTLGRADIVQDFYTDQYGEQNRSKRDADGP